MAHGAWSVCCYLPCMGEVARCCCYLSCGAWPVACGAACALEVALCCCALCCAVVVGALVVAHQDLPVA